MGLCFGRQRASASDGRGDLGRSVSLLGKVIVLGLPLEIAQFCIALWPWFLALTLLPWMVWWWRRRVGFPETRRIDRSGERTSIWAELSLFDMLLRPVFITVLTALMILVALFASRTIRKELLANNRFGFNSSKATIPGDRDPRPTAFASPDGRRWPNQAGELERGPADVTGEETLEVRNRAGEAAVYIKLCVGEALPRWRGRC